MEKLDTKQSQELYTRAKAMIPGGTQLLTKRPEMFLPDQWPAYYSKAKGCEVQDIDGNKYIDMSYMGIGSCILGYADDDVNAAVCQAIADGSMCTLNCPEEVELASKLIIKHPWAKYVRYARTGGEAMAIAVRIARTRTYKDKVLFCGYHGWHDWYLSANIVDHNMLNGHLLNGLSAGGVPLCLQHTAIPFKYNDIDEFYRLVGKYCGDIAAIVMEPIRNHYPKNNFLDNIKRVAVSNNIVLIFDEITSGFRLTNGGSHLHSDLDVWPHMAVFAKGISNGFPMAAVVGNGILDEAQNTFISSTYWTERIGPVAALATLEKIERCGVIKYINDVGKQVQDIWKKYAQKYDLSISTSGIHPLGHFEFADNNLLFKTLFTQFMLEEGFLATTSFYASFAHKKSHVDKYKEAVDITFERIKVAMDGGRPESYLNGPICHAGFGRLN